MKLDSFLTKRNLLPPDDKHDWGWSKSEKRWYRLQWADHTQTDKLRILEDGSKEPYVEEVSKKERKLAMKRLKEMA